MAMLEGGVETHPTQCEGKKTLYCLKMERSWGTFSDLPSWKMFATLHMVENMKSNRNNYEWTRKETRSSIPRLLSHLCTSGK